MSRGLSQRAAAIAVALWLAVALWPVLGAPLDGSFDSSWRWAINVAAARHLGAGLLPAGPLAFWLEPRATETNGLAAAATVAVLLRLVWISAWVGLFRSAVSRWRWAAWAGLSFAAVVIAGRWPDVEWLCLELALLAPWLTGERDSRLARANVVLGGLLAGLAPFVKVSLGAQALALAAAGAVVRARVAPRASRREIARLAAATAGGLAVGAVAAFDSLRELASWLAAAPSVLAGYGASMALFDRLPAERIGAAAALLALGGVAVSAARRSRLLPLWSAAAPALLAAAKYALVRQDVHAAAPILLMTVVLGLAGLLTREPRSAIALFVAGVLVAGLGAPLASGERLRDGAGIVRLVSGRTGAERAIETLRWKSHGKELQQRGGRRLARLVEREERRIVPQEGTLDVVPWRLTLLEAMGVTSRWVPAPTFQLFQASTPSLDRRVAAHFAGQKTADSLLVHFDPIDERQPLWEAPLAWRSILAGYEVGARSGRLLVLRRRAARRQTVVRPLGETVLEWKRWIALPRVGEGERLVAEIDFSPTPGGRLRRAWKRAEPVWIDLGGRGRTESWRLLPEQARFGLEIGAAPRNLGELERWLAGEPIAPPKSLRLRSADRRRYRPVGVRWLAARLAD